MISRIQPSMDVRFAAKKGEPIFNTRQFDVYRSTVEPEQTDQVSWQQLQDMMATVLNLKSNTDLDEADVAGLTLVKTAPASTTAEETTDAPPPKKGVGTWIKNKIGTLFEAAGVFARKIFWLMTRKDAPGIPFTEIRKSLNI